MTNKEYEEFVDSLKRWGELLAAPAIVGLIGLIIIFIIE